jgi:hypothetical protein
MKIIKLLFAFTLISFLSAGHHPFYVTVTEIEYSSKNKELGLSLKTFPDDLEETIRMYSGKKIDLSSKNNPQINQLISTYLQEHLTIEINKNKKQLNYLGYEIDKEAVWVYFNIPKINSIKELKVVSDVMYEYKPEQTNIVHINLNGSSKSYKLNAPNKVIVANN